tara:strand:+ start:1487 stop:1786 length:300 start_codon:yes stop_codon:yes gene_type:complete
MEDFEAYARSREKEILTKKDDRGEIDPRDEKGLIKVEDHKNLGRDPNSNAIINTDSAGYLAYVKARERARLKDKSVMDLKDEITELKDMLKVLVENSNK